MTVWATGEDLHLRAGQDRLIPITPAYWESDVKVDKLFLQPPFSNLTYIFEKGYSVTTPIQALST